MDNSFMNSFLRGFQAGEQLRRARQAEADDAEDRGIRRMLMQHQLRAMGIEDKLRRRTAQLQAHELRDGQPEAAFPIADAAFRPTPASSFFDGIRLPGQSFQLQDTRKIDPSVISGVEEYGLTEMRLLPQTLEQKDAAARAAERAKVRDVAPGHAVFQDGERIAYNPPNTSNASLARQYFDAISAGDTERAALLLKAIRDTGNADEPTSAGGLTRKFPNSNFGIALRIAVEDEEARLGRELRPDEMRRLQTATLRSMGSKSGAAKRAPGADDPAFPRGVEEYVIALRNRGATQAEALEEVFRADVWKKLTAAHPSLRAERLREAVTRLVPEEGAPPSPDPSAAQPVTVGNAGADAKVMTREELLAMAEAFNISEAEARRIYTARGYTIR